MTLFLSANLSRADSPNRAAGVWDWVMDYELGPNRNGILRKQTNKPLEGVVDNELTAAKKYTNGMRQIGWVTFSSGWRPQWHEPWFGVISYLSCTRSDTEGQSQDTLSRSTFWPTVWHYGCLHKVNISLPLRKKSRQRYFSFYGFVYWLSKW